MGKGVEISLFIEFYAFNVKIDVRIISIFFLFFSCVHSSRYAYVHILYRSTFLFSFNSSLFSSQFFLFLNKYFDRLDHSLCVINNIDYFDMWFTMHFIYIHFNTLNHIHINQHCCWLEIISLIELCMLLLNQFVILDFGVFI